ncbi:MAG: prepilin-type N-terminal cleavage/methylation domain-containing protein [Phycisphaerae bacterium]|nr:prepilin-type N-terminal cleavage/methylation domain-containing protein [Phycisphaerae bacterium]
MKASLSHRLDRFNSALGVQRHDGERGFTLLELLVVVAVIALLTAILIPSLNSARRQARTTLCAARLMSLTRAMITYAEEYGVPPFIGRGWEDLDGSDSEEWPKGSGITVGQLKRWEDWCVNRPEETWFTAEEAWPIDVGVEFGSLYRYTRFKDLYLCPEFQRVASKQKIQSVFNYTRTVLGRKWYVPMRDPEADEFDSGFGAPGSILRINEIHSPAKMWMILDEWYLKHCASPDNEFMAEGTGIINGGWMANDCMNFYLGDELGRYHGRQVMGPMADGSSQAVAMGHVSHYDGHVELCRDVLPGRTGNVTIEHLRSLRKVFDFIADHLFAQRGITVSMEEVLPS